MPERRYYDPRLRKKARGHRFCKFTDHPSEFCLRSEDQWYLADDHYQGNALGEALQHRLRQKVGDPP
ncbi:hypothetical protein ES703_106108 [subsurface metagenome]